MQDNTDSHQDITNKPFCTETGRHREEIKLTGITRRTGLPAVNTVESRRAGNVTFRSSKSPGAETLSGAGITGPVVTITQGITALAVTTNRAN